MDELYNLLRELMEARLLHPEAVPPELFVKLRQLIEWLILQPPWTYRRIQLARWSFVCEGLDIGEGWDGAFEYASEALRARPTKSESYLTRFGKERGSRIPLKECRHVAFGGDSS